MNKSRQHELLRWLRQQRHHGARSLRLASLAGFAAALILIARPATGLPAAKLLVEQQPRAELVSDFLLLLLCFALRAALHYGREMAGFRAGVAIRRALRQQVLDRLNALGPAGFRANRPGAGRRCCWNRLKRCRSITRAICRRCRWWFCALRHPDRHFPD